MRRNVPSPFLMSHSIRYNHETVYTHHLLSRGSYRFKPFRTNLLLPCGGYCRRRHYLHACFVNFQGEVGHIIFKRITPENINLNCTILHVIILWFNIFLSLVGKFCVISSRYAMDELTRPWYHTTGTYTRVFHLDIRLNNVYIRRF